MAEYLCSAFNPSKWTHTRSSGKPLLRRPVSSWGFGALLKDLTSVEVSKVERTLIVHSPHQQFLPDPRFETNNLRLQVWRSIH